MVVYACNPNIQETKAKGRGAQGHPWLPVKFEASLGYHETLLFKVQYTGCTFILTAISASDGDFRSYWPPSLTVAWLLYDYFLSTSW